MPTFKERIFKWLVVFVIKVLKCGPIPRHVALIMDGNRRYADKVGITRKQGHHSGFIKGTEVVQWCLDLGITEMSFYVFSLDNFKRTEEEVKNLMDLLEDKGISFLEKTEDLIKDTICIRALGDLNLLPVSLQEKLAKFVLSTRSNTRMYWNICISYSSREEMANAAREIAGGINEGLLTLSDITEELYTACFYATHPTPVDLLIRTSGEVRLSDFLLWQSDQAVLYFVKAQWPELGIRHIIASILCYQHGQRVMKGINSQVQPKMKLPEGHSIKQSELSDSGFIPNSTCCDVDSRGPYDEPIGDSKDADERRKSFLSYVQQKRLKQLEDMRAGRTQQNKPYFDDVPSGDCKKE